MTYPDPRPRTVVVICGSMRFPDELADAAFQETIAGRIVVAPHINMHRPHPMWLDPADAERIKQDLDALHLDKIRMADEVLVVDPAAYIGESTRHEIAFARSLGKPVRYSVDPDKEPGDPARIAEAVAVLQADASNEGTVARFGDRMAALHQTITQARAQDADDACVADETTSEADDDWDAWIGQVIGPRRVGGRYVSGYSGSEYEVVAIDPGPREGWPVWQITVRDSRGERSHCTAWNPRRDRIVHQPDDTSDEAVFPPAADDQAGSVQEPTT